MCFVEMSERVKKSPQRPWENIEKKTAEQSHHALAFLPHRRGIPLSFAVGASVQCTQPMKGLTKNTRIFILLFYKWRAMIQVLTIKQLSSDIE